MMCVVLMICKERSDMLMKNELLLLFVDKMELCAGESDNSN